MATDTDRIEKKILLRAPPARVWRALTNSEEFGSWFGNKFDGPFVVGASVGGTIQPTTVDPEVAKLQEPYAGVPFTLKVERMEPQRIFAFRWHPSAVERGVDYSAEPMTLVVFELQGVPEGTLLTVTESGFDRLPLERRAKAFTANEQGWSAVVKLLEKYLAQTA
jgi:uncharacterized protein YndB with AHSA1/START domain